MSETLLSSARGVCVILEWIEEDSIPYSYDIITSPPLEVTFNGSSTIQLTLSYNTLYNVSVVGTHPCVELSVTSFIELYYHNGKCF